MPGNKAAFDAALQRAQDHAFEDPWEQMWRRAEDQLGEHLATPAGGR